MMCLSVHKSIFVELVILFIIKCVTCDASFAHRFQCTMSE